MSLAIGYSLALLVGLSLGIFGAGGSILTVPIMVYVVGIEPVEATAYSLLIVGLVSIFGALSYIRRREVHIRTAIVFALPSVLAVYLTRRFLVQAIPTEIATVGSVVIGRDLIVMLLFGVLMAWAAVGMIRKKGPKGEGPETTGKPGSGAIANHGPGGLTATWPLVAAEGIGVGLLTGLVGAGGGFLIVPVLVLAAGMPMRQAVGTSLIIISLKSVVGFLGDLGAGTTIEWQFLLIFAGLAIVGVIGGSTLSSRVSADNVKPWFGRFVLLAGIVIIGTELLR